MMYHVVNTVDKPEFLDPMTDPRNITDEFKGLTTGKIREIMDARRVPAVNVAMNLTHDFNKSSALRVAEAHGFKEFVFVNRINEQNPTNPEGVKRWDKRGSVGMAHYANIRHVVDWRALFDSYRLEGYKIFAVDNIDKYEPKAIYDALMPLNSVFVYGEENLGLSDEMVEACDEMIYIPQRGVIRSINIATAAATVMYEYMRQNRNMF